MSDPSNIDRCASIIGPGMVCGEPAARGGFCPEHAAEGVEIDFSSATAVRATCERVARAVLSGSVDSRQANAITMASNIAIRALQEARLEADDLESFEFEQHLEIAREDPYRALRACGVPC